LTKFQGSAAFFAYGQSRVACGFRFSSDVDAGRQAGAERCAAEDAALARQQW
jgi:hypothetical protein